MLSKEERIQLRDELFEELINLKILYKIGKYYSFHSHTEFINKINNNIELKEKYKLYISQFRTENEAIYCIRYHDDFENHRCLECNNICIFYYNKKYRRSKYLCTCGNKICQNNRVGTKESIKKAKQTKKERHGDENWRS